MTEKNPPILPKTITKEFMQKEHQKRLQLMDNYSNLKHQEESLMHSISKHRANTKAFAEKKERIDKTNQKTAKARKQWYDHLTFYDQILKKAKAQGLID